MKIPNLKWLSIVTFIIALFFDGFCVEKGGQSIGVEAAFAFMAGSFAVLGGGVGLVWLANPLFFTSILLSPKKYTFKIGLNVIAILIALSFMLFEQSMIDSGGSLHPIISYSIGFWLWILSLFIHLLFLILNFKK